MEKITVNGYQLISYLASGTESVIYNTTKNRVIKISLLSFSPSLYGLKLPRWFQGENVSAIPLNQWIATIMTQQKIQILCPEIIVEMETCFTQQIGDHTFGCMILKNGGQPLSGMYDNVQTISQSLNALIEKAISKGIFHKDFHLGNILMDSIGVCRFIDFGSVVDIYSSKEIDTLITRYQYSKKHLCIILKSREMEKKSKL